MMNADNKMRLGLSMLGHGYHFSAWMHPDSALHGPTSIDYFLSLTRIAERGLFDMVFMADALYFPMTKMPEGVFGRRGDGTGLEPLTLLSALAPQTSNIGLVATASTTFSEPFHIARMFGSLDQISGGRAGWNVVTSNDDDEARNFSAGQILEKALRYARAEEFVDVVTGLWDSFDSDTFVADRSTGVYFRPDGVRSLNHAGKFFSVNGPLNVRKSPQGRPIIFQAGSSEAGQALAARSADVVYTLQTSLAEAKQYYAELKRKVIAHGREADSVKVMPGVVPIVSDTLRLAKIKYDGLRKLVDPLLGLEYLLYYFGDLSALPLDNPIPELREDRSTNSRGLALLQMARRDRLSIRDLLQTVSVGNAHHVVVGTPAMIADVLEQWFVEGGADGFNILPAVSPAGLSDFVDLVVPELQRRGLFRTSYAGTTLRANLGLVR
ncbi:LLM class flavin-dependent oxidoreductase [Caballeronia humi]|uniref:Monooxygenase n=1 Tax=Caballeronia humi TaxID=326474 RepID=A0A158IUW4_9BURK|nr:LLM class flavin-dependent oxidoreductase [Caballeronia humi]SAL59821.1 monooxygenase [Caballeronia humi]